MTPYGNNFKILFRKFSPPHRLTLLCSNFVKYCRQETARYLPDGPKKKQNSGCLSNCRYCSDRAQNLTGPAPNMFSQCSRLHPNKFTFGGVIAERLNTVFLPVEYFQDRLFQPITSSHLFYPECRGLSNDDKNNSFITVTYVLE